MAGSTLDRVIHCVAVATRYPISLLTASADLEHDLGIDSVKRVEIVLALGEDFKLDLQSEVRDPDVRTLQQVADWIDRIAGQQAGTAPRFSSGEPATSDNASESAGQATYTSGPSHDDGEYRQVDPTNPHDMRSDSAEMLRGPHFLRGNGKDISVPVDGIGSNGNAAGNQREIRSQGRGPANVPVDSASQSPSGELSGRLALVTGSGRGVGRVTARWLASLGATVIVNSFHSREDGERTTAEIRSQGGAAHHLWGSVANEQHVDEMFDRIEREFGYLDILICNASDGRLGPFLELTSDDWDRAFRTNVTGHHHCARRCIPLMRPRGGGTIVTLSAVGARRAIAGLGAQGVAKAAVETMTRYLSSELGRFGIRVNCVAGGPVYGDLLDKFPNAEETQSHWEAMTADGQLCSPMDLARTIGFLVSDAARGISGAIWMVDHGFSAVADGRSLNPRGTDNFDAASMF